MRSRLTLCILFLSGGIIQAQTLKQYLRAGDESLSEKDYYTALSHYQQALSMDTSSTDTWYRIAEAAMLYNAYDLADQYYEKVFNSAEQKNYPICAFHWGMIKKSKGEYDAASRLFESFEKSGNPDAALIEKAHQERDICQQNIRIMSDPDPVAVAPLSRYINSPYSEFAALGQGDTLFFSSYRFENKKDKHQPPRMITKLMQSVHGGKGNPMKKELNDDTRHTAHLTYGMGGNRMYFTYCDYVNAAEIRCAIFYREKDKRGKWGKAIRLPKSVNAEGYTSTEPNIGIDPVSGKEGMYFVSDRPGGKGKLDIWYTAILNNQFSDPINLEAVNTPENDITPFFQNKSHSLYFSSDGRESMGGYDIYKILQKDGQWGPVEHPGYPLNGSYNDIYFSVDSTGRNALFSSNRTGAQFLDPSNKNCCYDIFSANIGERPPRQPVPDTSRLVDKPPVNSPPVVVNPPPKLEPPPPTRLEDFLPLALYFDNDEPDKRTTRVRTKLNYEDTFWPFYESKSDFISSYTGNLPAAEQDSAAIQLDLFFEKEVKKGFDYLGLFSDILLERLQKGETIEIFIKGYTSPRAETKYNESLAKRRIDCIRNHFKTWQEGVFSSYINAGRLIISEKPFGELAAAKGISDDLNDRRNSIYSVGASRERRVEIVEIK